MTLLSRKLVTRLLRESPYYPTALKRLEEAYPATDSLTQQVQWLEADFNDSLMSIGSVEEALRRLPQNNGLYAAAAEWTQTLSAESTLEKTPERAEQDRKALAMKLQEVCTQAAFADGSELGHLLAIEPLLNLGKHFALEVPSALVVGAKGAGKTFTFRQLVQSLTWRNFLQKLGFTVEPVIDAAIFPVLWSNHIDDKPEGEIKTAQRNARKKVVPPSEPLLLLSEIKREIADALRTPPSHWDDFWDELVTRQFGLKARGLAALNELLRDRNQRIVLVFDGVEDAFQDSSCVFR